MEIREYQIIFDDVSYYVQEVGVEVIRGGPYRTRWEARIALMAICWGEAHGV